MRRSDKTEIARLQHELNTVKEQYDLACGCLSMIREDLAALMGESLATTPDMMLNDALRELVRRLRAKEAADAAH